MNYENITKDEYFDYERIRIEGKTNMLDINNVIRLSNYLNKEKIICIIKNYTILKLKYGDLK